MEQQKQVITLGLGDVDQPAEYLAHARLEREVLGAAGDGDDEVWGFQVPVLGHEIVECLRVRVTRQTDVLGGEKKGEQTEQEMERDGWE